MKKVGVITTSRADYWIYESLLRELSESSEFELVVFAVGMHLSDQYGKTVESIPSEFNVVKGRDTFIYGDDAKGIAQSMGATTLEMALMLERNPVDFLFCLGDRFEMFAAVSAVVPFGIPIGHLHGGETSEGAFDEKFRHAISKLSDLHFTSCEQYRNRVIQMGAEPKNVFNVGALGVEAFLKTSPMSRSQFQEVFGVDTKIPTLLVTYQPVTTEPEKSEWIVGQFCDFLEKVPDQVILTLGNADTNGSLFRNRLLEVSKRNSERIFVYDSLGAHGYYSAMRQCSMMVGNSSSGIIEAASANLPVVNVGPRQKGRATSSNVLHCGESTEEIFSAYCQALKISGETFENIYSKSGTVRAIVDSLLGFNGAPVYRFYNLEQEQQNVETQ